MTVLDGWFNWAQRDPGPEWKVYAGSNTGEFIWMHSFEGYVRSYNPVHDLFRRASWTGTILQDGRLLQHYDVRTRVWASGNANTNARGPAFELEGVAGEPPTPEQVATARRVIREIGEFRGRVYVRPDFEVERYQPMAEVPAPRGYLLRHCEGAEWIEPNAGATACESNRWEPIWRDMEDEMLDPRVDAIVAALGGMEEIEKWNGRGNSLLLGYAIEQEKQAQLAAEQVRLAEMVAEGDTLGAGDVVDAMKAMIAAWEREKTQQ